MPAIIHLSVLDARRFHRRALLLDKPADKIGDALGHLGFVQLDPINVCGRMHDLILRNRVAGYREGDLGVHLHGSSVTPLAAAQRTAFEHHLPHTNVLTVLPLEAWPHLLAAMRSRRRGTSSWSGKMNARQRLLAKSILAEIAARGALCSDDIDNDERENQGWGTNASLAKTTLHKLFFHGYVLIAKRIGNRRYYDFPERVLPAETLASPEPATAKTRRWTTLLKLRQRRLVRLSATELRGVLDLVQPLEVEGSQRLYCLRDDLPYLDNKETPAQVTLLAPLDPLIYDRRLTRELWGYDYTWEAYTPPSRRVRGYYALPVLSGLELVGHIDPKADRAEKKLKVASRSVRPGHRTAAALGELARFVGCVGR